MSLLDRFFPVQEQEAEEARQMQDLQEFLAWVKHPYYEKFMRRLEERANSPIPIGDQVVMIRGIERANTYREILTELRRDAERAAIQSARSWEVERG